MKLNYKIIASIVFIGACTILFFAFQKKGQPVREHFPQKTVYLYSLNPSVAMNNNSFPAMVRKLAGNGFTALKQNQEAGGMSFTSNDPSEFYEVNESEGHFSFSKNLSRYMGNYKPSLPDPKAAQQMAANFLKENKLMAENPDEMHLIHSGGLRADDEKGNVIDKMITLTYGRVLDGVPVIGRGSKIVVQVGENGAIEGMVRNWKAFSEKRQLSQAEIKSQEELEKEFRSLILTQFGKDAKAEVKRSYLVYFDNCGKYLQPVMAFESSVNIGGKGAGETKVLPYLGVVEVMRNPADKLNLTGVDPAGLRAINANTSSPETKPKPLDNGD